MRSVKKRILWTLLFLSVALVFWPGVTAAQQLTMYELTEQVKYDGNGQIGFSVMRTAALQGTSPVGTPVCPSALRQTVCTLTATATASGNPYTGSLSVTGDYAVVAQEPGSVDSPEVVVQAGTFGGTVDLTPALSGAPFLGITGTFTPTDGATANFTGKFRIPFSLSPGGARVGPIPGQGTLPAGTPVCPTALGMSVCTLTATATASGDPRTGSLSVTGAYAVVAQEPGSVDSPEVVVQDGTFDGTVDLTPVLVKGLPFLGIGGTFTPNGSTAASSFSGKFRIPFSIGPAGTRVGPKPGQSTFYLKESGQLEPLQINELSLGYATVRLEVTFQ